MQLVTQCEANFARQIFPCIDEPCFKAVFQLSIWVEHPSHIALSNTPCSKIEDLAEGRLFHFEETPKMSTYLFAFVVGMYEHHEIETKRGIKVRSYTPVGQIDQSLDLLKIAAESIDLYEDYF